MRAWMAVAACTLGCAASLPSSPSPSAAQASPPRPARPAAFVELRPDGRPPVRVEVEVARTDAARRRGLMGRRYLRRGHGMLFVYDAPGRQEFWMRNTFVSLDMIFIDADRRVVGVVERAAPLTEELRAVDAESQYVLEVGAGFASAHGIAVGTSVVFENVAEELEDEGS